VVKSEAIEVEGPAAKTVEKSFGATPAEALEATGFASFFVGPAR
jgi:hypothetical protein